MPQFFVYLKVEPYLAQWFIHEMGGNNPVQLPRGSAESDILEFFLRPRHLDEEVELQTDETNLVIAIPSFKSKDVRYHNFLPARAKRMLIRTIYTRLRIQLWEEMHRLENIGCPITDMVYAWMEKHGIEESDKNWETLRQMYMRKRHTYSKGYRKKKLSFSLQPQDDILTE